MQTIMQLLHIMEVAMEAINHLIQMRTATRIATVVACLMEEEGLSTG
jgi:hypothetical protein